MKLTVFNGSPRGTESNTKILLDAFKEGFLEENTQNLVETAYLNRTKQHSNYLPMFEKAEVVFLAFPLYHDSMPAQVKWFIESLEPFCQKASNPAMLFLVQSGFMEAAHSRYVERYLKKLTQRLHSRYIGTIIKGGVEGIQIKPAWMVRKMLQRMSELGKYFSENKQLNPEIIQQLARPEHLGTGTKIVMKLLKPTGITNMYWNMQLKKNKAYDQRFARPFASE